MTVVIPSSALRALLGGRDDDVALIEDGRTLTYAALRRLVAERVAMLATVAGRKRLVQVEFDSTVESVATYLAALEGGHVALVTAPGERAERATATYSPDVRVTPTGQLEVRHPASGHDLHPDLAALMSTSGSTGSPRMVRLSRENVLSNASAIATTLRIRRTDRAITTLPLHYCYGLSVVLSHLAAGASVVLTRSSVLDPEHWALIEGHGVTSLSGVPHTFDLLETAGLADRDLPRLRYVTQAGGRMAPDHVRRWAERGQRRGWDFIVMYGQTEATARMAVLPPELAHARPECAGCAIVGTFELKPLPQNPYGEDAGELVYTGPGVMLGYAETSADLANGREHTSLATGDVARIHEDGLVEIVGRRSTFLKIHGLRIDPHQVEKSLEAAGIRAVVGGDDTRLAVAVQQGSIVEATAIAGRATGLPPHLLVVRSVPRPDALPSGKLDRHATITGVLADDGHAAYATPETHRAGQVTALYAHLLGRPDATDEMSFVDLGGDSLSYVEVSIRLEELLGELPEDWSDLTPAELAATTAAPSPERGWWRRELARVETSVLLRALAIVLIVGTHTHVWYLPGGAHVLLAIAGYNLGRFAMTSPSVRERAGRIARSVGRIVVPSAIWMSIVGLTTGAYSAANVLMVNSLFGPDHWTSNWRVWFIEALVWCLVGLTALVSIPPVARALRRHPFAVPYAAVLLALPARLPVFDLTAPPGRGTAPAILWLVVLGWAAAAATTTKHRWLLTAAALAGSIGFFGQPAREAVLLGGLLLVIWVSRLTVPRRLLPVVGLLASSSLYVYLTHFEVYRLFDSAVVNLAVSLSVGVLAWLVVEHACRFATRTLRTLRSPAPAVPAGRVPLKENH